MLSLPREIFLNHILNDKTRYYTDYDEDEDPPSIKDLEKEFGSGHHCTIWYLYATCKSFNWLDQYEYIYSDTNEFEAYINTCNIRGQLHGMRYNYGNFLYGYSNYNQGDEMYGNMLYNGPHHRSRYIDDKKYMNWHKCDSSPDRYRTKCIHEHCLTLNKVNDYVTKNDPLIREIMKSDESEIWEKIFIRLPILISKEVQFIHNEIPKDYKCIEEVDDDDILL